MVFQQSLRMAKRYSGLLGQLGNDYRVHRNMVSSTGRGFWDLFRDQVFFLISNSVTAQDYYKFGFHLNSLSKKEKRYYLGSYQDWRVFHSINNNMAACKVLDDKLKFSDVARNHSVMLPETLALVSTNSERGSESAVKTLGSREAFLAWIEGGPLENFVLKPLDGVKGIGVKSIGERLPDKAAWRELPGGQTATPESLWSFCEKFLKRTDILVQRRLRPHRVLEQILPDVLHTVRIVTYVSEKVILVDAVLRVGRGQAPADNLAQGGLMVPINIATGVCGQPSMIVDGVPQAQDCHPLTGTRITGTQLPEWEAACDLAIRAAQIFKHNKSVGWDIAMTSEGLVLLEGNWRYDLGVNQVAHRKGILALSWSDVFVAERAYEHVGLGLEKLAPSSTMRPGL